MSGPKCNEFQLSEQRRLEELRKIEEELRRAEEERRREEKRRQEEERRKKEKERAKKNDELQAQSMEIDEWIKMERERRIKEREQQIIAEAIDEAMEELGYDLVASIKPEESQKTPIQAQVFSFFEGVGVQVIEAEGRISMEVVGLGTTNRKPTDSESAYLESQMKDFCDAYGKLEKMLQEKGIIKTTTIRHLPPSKEYARILNIDSFSDRKETVSLQSVMKKHEKKTEGSSVQMHKTQKKQMGSN